MKKNVLALSIAAMIGGLGFVGAASASVIVGQDRTGATDVSAVTVAAGKMLAPTVTGFQLAEGGVGHALVIPYYTVQGDNATILHLVNTDTKNGKVAKIRFRGAANSDDVLDFQVLLSPGDVWTAAVTKGDNGFAQLVTADNTCSIPAFEKGVPVSFLDGRLNPNLKDDALANQTREGYVEIFNSADIPGGKFYGKDNDANSALYTATKHVAGKAPCTASVIQSALYDTDFTPAEEGAAVKLGLDAPTGGLTGDWYIMNVPNTTTYSGAATALVGQGGKVGNFVAFPQNDTIKIATPEKFTADPSLVSKGFAGTTKDVTGKWLTADETKAAVIEAIALDFPDLSTPYYAPAAAQAAIDQAANLTQALAVSSITNQYAKDASIIAKTDWVFSMPTRRYAIAANYAAASTATVANTADATKATTYRVINEGVSNSIFANSANTNVNSIGQICASSIGATFFDREETSRVQGAVFSPGTVTNTPLCG